MLRRATTTVLVSTASVHGCAIHERPRFRSRFRKTMTLMTSKLPDSDGLEIHYVTRSVSGDDGDRDCTVSMILVNGRTPATSDSPELRNRTYAIQPQMEVRSKLPFPKSRSSKLSKAATGMRPSPDFSTPILRSAQRVTECPRSGMRLRGAVIACARSGSVAARFTIPGPRSAKTLCSRCGNSAGPPTVPQQRPCSLPW